MTIHVILLVGLVFTATVGAYIGIEAYEAGWAWEGATILGGAIFLALSHVWEKTTGVHDSKTRQRPAMTWEVPCPTCGKDADEMIDGDCPDCNPPTEQGGN